MKHKVNILLLNMFLLSKKKSLENYCVFSYDTHVLNVFHPQPANLNDLIVLKVSYFY